MNKLKNEKSSYLLQHAENPVDWYAWSDEAFNKAKQEDKPIILSIGYSACHWCHVMAHESFEDESTANIMNQSFINIKLDKEERPDIDKIYQMAQTIITGKTGGWPLTIFMTPKGFPFFAGTYFPNEEKFGLPSFKEILKRVSDFYKNQRKDIDAQNLQISNIFKSLNKQTESKNIINKEIIDKTKKDLLASFDRVHGGFGSAPKFPHSTNINFLLKCINKDDKELFKYLSLTLDRMCFSGIYDHLEGGFFRYSVDELWMIPHFEKMLYDNGPMIDVLCNGYRKIKNPILLTKIKDTCEWLIKTMQDNSGGFFSTIDADSEHVEGKYYVWSIEELKSILNDTEFELIKKTYFVYDKPNFEGKYHFHIIKNNENYYKENIKDIEKINKKLLVIRDKRIKPNTDKKILVSWNALAIIGLLNAYKLTNDMKYFTSARKCFNFIKDNMWVDEKLYACFHDNPCFDAYLDDFAFLAKSCIEFLKINWNEDDFSFLKELSDNISKNFEDKVNGGFYFTSINHEELIYRPKTYMDESLPSGNSIATEVFLELSALTGNNVYLDIADKSFKSASDSIMRSSSSHCSLLSASLDIVSSKKTIIIRCNEDNIDDYKRRIFSLTNIVDSFYFIKNNEKNLSKEMQDKKSIGDFTAYICQDFVCSNPINNFDELYDILSI